MTTARTLVATAQRRLLGGKRERRTTLASGVLAGDTSLTIATSELRVQAGDMLAVDLELIQTNEPNGATMGGLVRGDLGSTAAAHLSGASVALNPRWPTFDLFEALNDELRDLSTPGNGLYRELTVELNYDADRLGYNLTGVTTLDDVLDVEARQYDNSLVQWFPLSEHHWRLQRQAKPGEFASGLALYLHTDAAVVDGQPIRVTYKAPFGLVASLDDNVETTTGVWTEAVDLLWMGAALIVGGVKEIRRNDTESQGDTRRPDEVPPGAVLNSIRGLAARYARRIEAERTRLHQRRPKFLVV